MIDIESKTLNTASRELATYDVTVANLDTGELFVVQAGLLTACRELGGHGAQIKVGFWLQSRFDRFHFRTLGFNYVPEESNINNRKNIKSYQCRIEDLTYSG